MAEDPGLRRDDGAPNIREFWPGIMRPHREGFVVNRKLARKLTHIFGMTRRRDAMLGDLLYSLKTEGLSANAENLALDLAYCHHRSEDIARCLSAAVDFLEAKEGARHAHDLAYRMAVAAGDGPVAITLASRLTDLKRRADMEPMVKKQMEKFLDRIRTKDLEVELHIRPTVFCFDCVDPRRRRDGLSLTPIEPYRFVQELER